LDRFCANEADYHQRVIRHLATFPDLLKARPGLETFVWGARSGAWFGAMKLTCMTLAAAVAMAAPTYSLMMMRKEWYGMARRSQIRQDV
jgi:hypothetical protein